MTAEEVYVHYVQDAFINGLASGAEHQQLLENIALNLKTTYEQACTLEMAQEHSVSCDSTEPVTNAAVPFVRHIGELCSVVSKTDSVSAATSSA